MFNFYSLYSSSNGNSLLIETEYTKLLIDTGVSCKKIENALSCINILPSEIDGILVTHEHIDHVQSLGTFSKKYNIPTYVNNQTLNAMPKQKDKIPTKNIKNIEINKTFEINDLTIKPFSIPHDAINPCGFSILRKDKKICIATDIGQITDTVLKNLENSSFIFLESNYDDEKLKNSSYNYILKKRISGPKGHLSNSSASKIINHLLNHGLENVLLGHLSQENNCPELAYNTVYNNIPKSYKDTNKITINVANKDKITKIEII